QAADLAVTQPVVDEGEDLAGPGDLGLLLPSPLGDLVEGGLEMVAAVVADYRFECRPPHQLGSLLGDPAPGDFGVGLAMERRESRPRAQRLGGTEPGHVTDLSHEDRGEHTPNPVDGLHRLIATVG